MAQLYKPPIAGSTVSTPFLSVVMRADPDFQRFKFREREYEMANKVFYANNAVRGAYNQFSNVYPVGQPSGALDPAYAARPFYAQSGDKANTKG